MVRDSYSDSLAPFLSQAFSEIHLLDLRYYRTSAAQYAEENDMDMIFVCYNAGAIEEPHEMTGQIISCGFCRIRVTAAPESR